MRLRTGHNGDVTRILAQILAGAIGIVVGRLLSNQLATMLVVIISMIFPDLFLYMTFLPNNQVVDPFPDKISQNAVGAALQAVSKQVPLER